MSELVYREFVEACEAEDAAHSIEHIERVVVSAKKFALAENADLDIVVAAAWLHDCVSVRKDSPLRSKASQLAAQKAAEFLSGLGRSESFIADVCHAIEAHSFSAGITPTSLEAQIVQDADRIDALGAIGIARCILVSASLNADLYCPQDPLCLRREPDDSNYCIDHFHTKLFKIAKTLNTDSARKEAEARVQFMQQFLSQLDREVNAEG